MPLEEALVFSPEKSSELLKLDEALERLAKRDPRQSKIIELRFFGGFTVEQTAELMGISAKTVKREYSMAKAWLRADLTKTQQVILAFWFGPAVAVNFGPPGRVLATLRGWGNGSVAG